MVKAEEIESQNGLSSSQLPEPSKGTSLIRTCFNGLNTLAGVGMLSIPYALSQGGWLSLILLFVIAILCWYTGLLLNRCMDADPAIKTYPDIGHRAFGYKGRALVSIFMHLELFLVAVEFLILEGDNLDKLFSDMKLFKLGGLIIGGKKGFIVLTAILVLPTTWLRSLGVLAYLSAGGILASIVLVGCVLWIGAIDGVGFHEKGEVLNWGGLPTTVSVFTFCYCGHAVFPTLANSMKDRSQFSKVLFFCFVASTITYGSMPIMGYLMYGNYLKSQVTLNLPIKRLSTKVAIYTTVVNPLTKYAVMTTPIATTIEDMLPSKNRASSILIRSALVISTLIVAITVPFFAYVMDFIGSFLSVTVSLLFPCLCYLKINNDARRFGLEFVVIMGIIIVGSFVGMLGTYISLEQIIINI